MDTVEGVKWASLFPGIYAWWGGLAVQPLQKLCTGHSVVPTRDSDLGELEGLCGKCGIWQVGLLWMETREGRDDMRKGEGREAVGSVLSLRLKSSPP